MCPSMFDLDSLNLHETYFLQAISIRKQQCHIAKIINKGSVDKKEKKSHNNSNKKLFLLFLETANISTSPHFLKVKHGKLRAPTDFREKIA